MNDFGGNWTEEKIELFMKYVPAYLTIMNSQIKNQPYARNWKLLYFDGFAGSGGIMTDSSETFIEGVATRVLKIDSPREFDMYRFVEMNRNNAEELTKIINEKFSAKLSKVKVYQEDFNQVIFRLVEFLKNNNNYKVLAFVDPFGMEVNWSSIELLKELPIDMWILIPTGMGVNRLLKNNGDIDESWVQKLQCFLGLNKEEISQIFYKKETVATLFGEDTYIKKQENAIEKSHKLYKDKLKQIFKHVSDSYVMRNSSNSILYHFVLASNSPTAVKIGSHIVGKGITKI